MRINVSSFFPGGPVPGVALCPLLPEEALAFDVDDGAADGQDRAVGGEVEIFPSQGKDLADAGACGEHEVDGVGQVAGVPRSRPAGDGLLPLTDRRAYRVQGGWLARAPRRAGVVVRIALSYG